MIRSPVAGQVQSLSYGASLADSRAAAAAINIYDGEMLRVHLEDGVVSVLEAPVPARPAGYALLRLLVAGICNTDLELQRGYYHFAGTPGHEFVAEVAEADDAALRGKRVVGEINLACLQCEWCRKGLGRHCPHRSVLGIVRHPGAFEEFFTLPERNLHVLPEGIPLERAVFTEPLAAACEILDQVTIPACAPIAVLGDGKLGLLVAQVLGAYGYPVRLFGHHQTKLRIAEAAGIEVEMVNGQLPVAAYDWVVEASGSAAGLRQAVAMTRPRTRTPCSRINCRSKPCSSAPGSTFTTAACRASRVPG